MILIGKGVSIAKKFYVAIVICYEIDVDQIRYSV